VELERALAQAFEEMRTPGADLPRGPARNRGRGLMRDNLDLYTPSGRLMFQIIGAMAEFERALIAERVKAGMRNAKAKGKRIGRPPRTYLDGDTRHAIAQALSKGRGKSTRTCS
jgi:Resolvase, N terminal domain